MKPPFQTITFRDGNNIKKTSNSTQNLDISQQTWIVTSCIDRLNIYKGRSRIFQGRRWLVAIWEFKPHLKLSKVSNAINSCLYNVFLPKCSQSSFIFGFTKRGWLATKSTPTKSASNNFIVTWWQVPASIFVCFIISWEFLNQFSSRLW